MTLVVFNGFSCEYACLLKLKMRIFPASRRVNIRCIIACTYLKKMPTFAQVLEEGHSSISIYDILPFIKMPQSVNVRYGGSLRMGKDEEIKLC